MKALRDEMRANHCAPSRLDARPHGARSAGDERRDGGKDRDRRCCRRRTRHRLGHARVDRGIPAVLARDTPGRRLISVGMIEVQSGRPSPKDYAADWGAEGSLPFDYVIFTPAENREDPCEKLAQRTNHRPAESH